MGKKTETTAVFVVRLRLPTGSTAASAQLYIREAITSWGGGKAPDDPFFKIPPEDFTVALKEKVTRYGS